MTTEQFRQEMTAIADEMKRKNYHIYDTCTFAPLNKYFGVTYCTDPYGVQNVWVVGNPTSGYFHCEVTTAWYSSRTQKNERKKYYESDNQYLKEKGVNLHTITGEQMTALVEFFKDWLVKEDERNAALYERGKQEISIEDLQTECEKIANEILAGKKDKYGNPMRAKLAVGKRGCDTDCEPYTALCIEYYGNVFGNVDWHYTASMTFYKDKYGINQISYRAPLCGESHGEFDMDEFKQYVESCLR